MALIQRHRRQMTDDFIRDQSKPEQSTGPTGCHRFCSQLRCMWGKSCRRPALLVPCATTAQWASYAISLLSKMRFVWVNRGIITIPEQMCLRCAAKRCRLQDEVCEFSATFQRCMCDLRQANRFAVSLPSVLPSLYPSPPPSPPRSLASPPSM